MKWASYIYVLAGGLHAISSALKPLVTYDADYVGVSQQPHFDFELFENLEERVSPINIGTYSLAKQFSKDFVLLQISLGKSTSVNTLGDKGGGSFSATITCLSCYITGDVVVTTTGVTTHESFFQEIAQAFTDPIEALVNTFDLNLKFSLENFGGHFEFDITFAGSGTYTIQLWKSESPVGIQLDDNVGVGLLFSLELTFTVTAEIDFTTGFDILFPSGTNFVLDPLTGEIVSMNIGGVKVNSIPFQFNKGSACVTAILRLKAQLKLEIMAWGEGFDIEAGLFWDPAVYKACAVYQPSSPCEISLTEGFFEDAGAYARAVIDVNFANFSAGPTAVTTYYSATLPPQCLETSKSTPHTTAVRETTKTSGVVKLTTPIKETSAHEQQTTTRVTTSVLTKQSTLSDTTHVSTKISSSSKHTSSASHESSPTISTATGKSASESSSEKSSTGSHSGTSKSSSSTSKSSETGSPGVSSTGKHISSSHEPSATDMTSTGNKYHSESENSSRPPYGNYSITKTAGTDTMTLPTNTDTSSTDRATLSTNTGISSTGSATLPSNVGTSSTGTATDNLSTDTTSSDTNGSTSSLSPPPDTGSGTSGTGTVPVNTFLTTVTIWTTEIYTITACISLLEWCPYYLTSEMIQTKTVVQYTTICPATQTNSLSTELPAQSPAAAASTTVPTRTPIVVVANPVEMIPCETPIISTVSLASPLPPITYTLTGNGTTAYPVVYGTTWYSPTYVQSSTDTTSSGISINTSMSTISSTSGVAIAIYSIGGFASPPLTSSTPEAKAQGTATMSATPSYVQASGARSPFTSPLVERMAVAFLTLMMLSMGLE